MRNASEARNASYVRDLNAIRSGDIFHLTRAASVQFGIRPILFRVIRVENKSTYEGYVWLDGYELDSEGLALERRSVFVQVAGLRRIQRPSDWPVRPVAHRSRNERSA